MLHLRQRPRAVNLGDDAFGVREHRLHGVSPEVKARIYRYLTHQHQIEIEEPPPGGFFWPRQLGDFRNRDKTGSRNLRSDW